jgi:hypothetical protein
VPFADTDPGLTLIRPARTRPRTFPNWLRQRVEAVIWTLKNRPGLERRGGRVPTRLWARIVQRLRRSMTCSAAMTTGSRSTCWDFSSRS